MSVNPYLYHSYKEQEIFLFAMFNNEDIILVYAMGESRRPTMSPIMDSVCIGGAIERTAEAACALSSSSLSLSPAKFDQKVCFFIVFANV